MKAAEVTADAYEKAASNRKSGAMLGVAMPCQGSHFGSVKSGHPVDWPPAHGYRAGFGQQSLRCLSLTVGIASFQPERLLNPRS